MTENRKVIIILLIGVAIAGIILAVGLNYDRCAHNWQVLDKTVLPSGYEQMRPLLEGAKSAEGVKFSGNMWRTKVLVIVQCPKCGALRTVVKANP